MFLKNNFERKLIFPDSSKKLSEGMFLKIAYYQL